MNIEGFVLHIYIQRVYSIEFLLYSIPIFIQFTSIRSDDVVSSRPDPGLCARLLRRF